jgi:MoaA/NifB/PqqE/SkfB family radical SAM enzyme
MFKFNQLEQVQIEITNRCQASCPMCARNIHGGIDNPLLTFNDWTFENFVKIFHSDILHQLKILIFCGDFGDPILNNDLIKMCEYLKQTSPNIIVHIHTNGSARNKNWWETLANSLPNNHKVFFALDGLKDTHHIHRIGTDFNKIIENATTFINANGTAEWCFIRFKHNAHQVDEAKSMSIQLGFKDFSVKNSKRFNRPFPVVDKEGKFLYNIEQPDETPIKFVGKSHVANNKDWENADQINCQSIQEKDIYIDAHYLLSPCCMIGAFLYTSYDSDILKKYNLYEEDSIIEEGYKVQQEVLSFPRLNVLDSGLKEIIESEQWQTMWQQKWKDRSSSTCIIMCGPKSPYIKISEQVIKDV